MWSFELKIEWFVIVYLNLGKSFVFIEYSVTKDSDVLILFCMIWIWLSYSAGMGWYIYSIHILDKIALFKNKRSLQLCFSMTNTNLRCIFCLLAVSSVMSDRFVGGRRIGTMESKKIVKHKGTVKTIEVIMNITSFLILFWFWF